MCKKRWQRGRSQKCSIRVSRLIGRRCKIGVDNCRRQLHLLTEDTEGSNSVPAECCWDFGMQIKSSSAITAMKIKTLYYWKRFQKCKEVLKLTATRQRKTHWTRKYCGSEPYPRETITGCVCMYVKFIYIAHLSCKHATNERWNELKNYASLKIAEFTIRFSEKFQLDWFIRGLAAIP